MVLITYTADNGEKRVIKKDCTEQEGIDWLLAMGYNGEVDDIGNFLDFL